MTAARELEVTLSLLDRQLIDRDGMLVGKVDDLEFRIPEHGPPIVTNILSGPGAMATRIGGRFGRWIERTHSRLRGEPGPARVPFHLVAGIGSHITLAACAEDLASNELERWARDVIVDHIPGARHASE